MENKIVYAFIDSQNLNLGIRSLGWKLDFERFRIYLKDKYKVKKAILFLGYIKENEKMYSNLKEYGYEIIFKPTIKVSKNKTKGNVDAELVLHAAKIEYNNYDKGIIVSGDGDFFCLVEDMRKEKRLERLIIPNRKSYSSLLVSFRDYMVSMNNFEHKLGKRTRSVSLSTKS